jgi:hypothetical protein
MLWLGGSKAFHHVSNSRFLYLPLECEKSNSSRTSVTHGATVLPLPLETGQSNQFSILIGQETYYIASHWSESKGY